MKTLICFGTRPEAIKMAMLCREFKSRQMDFKVCVTAQHREMLDQVLDFFELRPDYDLDLMQPSQSLNSLASRIFGSIDAVLEQETFDLVLVHGDTLTSTLVAQAAFYRECRVGHVEAGLRTYDKKSPFPEELNRQLTTRIADYHFAPTRSAARNLLKEGVAENNICITGNTVIDALMWTLEKVLHDSNNTGISLLKKQLDPAKKLILITGHRRENQGGRLEEVCRALLQLTGEDDVQLVFALHKNPRVRSTIIESLENKENILLINTPSYPVFVWLMHRAHVIISDSGGIQEEAPTLNVPVVVTRTATERQEGVDRAYAILTGTNKEKIVTNVKKLLEESKAERNYENPYGDGKASQRIADFILNLNA